MAPARILVIEEELELQETLTDYLTQQGYQVETAGDGKTGLAKALQDLPDLVIMDVILPVMNGWEVCRILRKESNVPIIILTTQNTDYERVKALEMGADDYVTKPFRMGELIARVKAQLRRVQIDRTEEKLNPKTSSQLIQIGNLELNLIRHEARLNGKVLNLQPKEYDLLVFLIQHNNQDLSREQILREVWGWDYAGGTRTVDVHISWLREKIEPDPEQPTRIITVRGVGYRFVD